MQRTSRTPRGSRHARSLPECLRQFLTPDAWRQARAGLRRPRADIRWDFHPLVLVLLAMTWAIGDGLPERFDMARGIVALCRPKRRRPGRTEVGFRKALIRLPIRPLAVLAAAIRDRLAALLGDALTCGGFVPLGCDGSRLECPRTDELIARLGRCGKGGSAPALWVTALVHLGTGIPWSWRLGRGDADERGHLRALLPTLPRRALIVADAGYNGYDLAAAIRASGASFLIRMSSTTRLFVDGPIDPRRFTDGPVRHWPQAARERGLPPLELRLIRARGRRPRPGKRRADVWLLTDVGADRLPASRAAELYRRRWENEGLFRSYKRTLSKVRLTGRTVRAVHREAYGSLLACQLLLAQAAAAIRTRPERGGSSAPPCGARGALLAVRAELRAVPSRRCGTYRDRLSRCMRERRERTSAKSKRSWPERTPHRPPRPPQLLTMGEGLKRQLNRLNPVP
jgi:Transposase DDE domain